MQQSEITILIIVAAIVIAAAIIWFAMRQRRSKVLHDRFGDEYDRTVSATGKRSAAEENLLERERRARTFDIRPLTTDEHDRFAAEWKEVKALFVDSPQEAVLRGDRLLGSMMETRGYPMADFDRRYEDLTVDHAAVARHYRDGHDIAAKAGDATTEEMRRALNNYEKLFDELISDVDDGDRDEAVDIDGDGRTDTVMERERVTRPS